MDAGSGGFGSYLHQGPIASSNGYNATIWGTALGYDILALKNLRVGLSGGFAQDFVRTKDSSGRTDIDNYQGALYGSYAKDAYYIILSSFNVHEPGNIQVGCCHKSNWHFKTNSKKGL